MILVERLWPSVPGQPLLRRGFTTDLAYGLFTPVVTRAISRGTMILALVIAAVLLCHKPDRAVFEAIVAGYGPIGAQPKWLQAIELIVILDFLGYWLHRMFHGRRWWAFHEVHHSSEDLDWLSSVRVHPINDLVNRIVPAVIVVALGFSLLVLAAALPFLAVYAILLHANVNWDFGPLKSVLASPAFHRWHHTSAEEGRDKNFAGLLPVWDIMFGTWFMPASPPPVFGSGRPLPKTLFGQLLWPFRQPRGGDSAQPTLPEA